MSERVTIEAEIVEDDDGPHHTLKVRDAGKEERLLAIREQASVARWRAAAGAIGVVAFFAFCSTCVYSVCGVSG